MNKKLNDLRGQLHKKGLDAFLVTSVYDIAYFTNYSNFSIHEREAYLFITKDTQYILTDGRYSEVIENQLKEFKLIKLGYRPMKDLFKELFLKHAIKTIGVDEKNITAQEYKFFKKINRLLKHFDTSKIRIIKSEDEIRKIEKACQIGDTAFKHILNELKVGISEKEIAFEIETFIKKYGGDISFPTIVAFGANSSVPHHQTGSTELKKPSMILLDFGVKINNYCSDMTRTIFFGKATKKQKEIYQVVLGSQTKAVELIKKSKNNIKAELVDKKARDYIKSKSYPSIPHSLGHGVGHEIHERPWISARSKDILKPGMVFSIEPGIYIPKFGGVRIEDLFVIENGSIRKLTKSSKKLIEI